MSDASGVDAILGRHSPSVVASALSLRAVIRAELPHAQERAYHGWHGIGYVDPTYGYVCAIFPRESDVRLAFEYGALMPNTLGMLHGDGRRVRYYDLPAGELASVAAVAALVQEALSVMPAKTARRRTAP